ncbi:MAG: efflux RND transporter periplasmic adaptor subunit [Desulfuromonadaceae bacterium]|nr:efflux RND transporter periplasmic adaptor subunit [Desulfuromonadaceae bacterium]MDD2855529.1 efflux RND transporter periplasmic adaptor subunit [Desulfuromonadaceae bacterium]
MKLLKKLEQMKSLLIWLLLVVVAAVILKAALFTPTAVKIVKLEKRDLSAQVYGNGTVEARVVVGLSSKITGRIVELYADQGDRVTRGQLLVKLESEDMLHQKMQSEAGVRKAVANLELENANLQKACANLILAESNARRFKLLLDAGMVASQEAEQYENIYQLAKEEVARSNAAIKAVKMDCEASRAALGFARSKLAETNIYSPIDGIIISRDLEKGSTAVPGQPIFTLADPATVWVKANVDESELKGVAVGKSAVINLRSLPGEQLAGKVARIANQSDRVTEELQVEVSFTPPLNIFRLGEQSEVYITTDSRKNVPSLPSSSLVYFGGKQGVWVADSGVLKFKPVSSGIRDRADFTEIIDGIDVSDQVVIASPAEKSKFRDGMKVRIK